MNTKKKHKKANKTSNPNPPPKVEKVSKPEENIEVLEPKCEVIEEKTIPLESVKQSQIVELEVQNEAPASERTEVREMVGEIPKKPKRNKKKKQDKDGELVEHISEKVSEVQQEPIVVPVQEKIEEIILEEKKEVEKGDPFDEAAVVPSARKKKNKKKAQDKPLEETKVLEEVSEPVPTEQIMQELEKIDTEIDELMPTKPATPKEDGKKKKNKKKKRNDSEKSDKSEDIVSCTSAFQQLLVEEKKSQEEKTNVIVEENQEVAPSIPLQKSERTNIADIKPLDEMKEAIIVQTEPIKESPREDSKGKKKNKKDKKVTEKEQAEEQKQSALQKIPIAIDNLPTQNVVSEETKPDNTPLKEEELSPKPKAKIAKPVEKKRKGKQDQNTQSTENLLNIECPELITEETKDLELSAPPIAPETKKEDLPVLDIIEAQVPTQLEQKLVKTPQGTDKIVIPAERAMGKKRKKSPKLPKQKDIQHDILKSPEEIQSEVKAPIKESAEIAPPLLLPPELSTEIKECIEPVPSDLAQMQSQMPSTQTETLPVPKFDTLSKEISKPQEEKKMDIPEYQFPDRQRTPEIKKDDDGFETKTSKKKKKMPKSPVQPNAKSESTIPITKMGDVQVNPKQCAEEKVNIPSEVPLTADLEEINIKIDKSGASPSDTNPDVLFIRSSSSQQLLDNNNNTVIQELSNVEEIKSIEPLSIPLIEGSGETPILTPELDTSDIKMTEIQPKIPTEEKTDLKSKMMEVNQDMEELRLSIERSLAEFTAMEKHDKEPIKEVKSEMPVKFDESSPKEKQKKDDKKEQTKPVQVENLIASETKKDIPKDICTETEKLESKQLVEEVKPTPPVCPARKDHKGKSKSKKKEKQESAQATTTTTSDSSTAQSKDKLKEEKTDKSEKKSDTSQEKGKQQSAAATDSEITETTKGSENENQPKVPELPLELADQTDYEPIEHFEDALTSSIDDVNKTFELIAKDADDDNDVIQKKLAANKPDINVTEPLEDTKDSKSSRDEKMNPVSQPKNLLGQNNIPVQSNKTDYKKEKNKTPNARQARVKIKDSNDVESKKPSKESQTDNKNKKNSDRSVKECFSKVKNDHEEYVYKYSFRRVFLQSACHVCNKELNQVRIPCGYCNLLFYCGAKHKDEDWPQHQALCFAVSTIAHMKDQKHIYADVQNTTGQDYRLLRMQMIVSCEKVLKRRLVPWEQEAMLYPRICADVACREWRQAKLKDCEGCGQLSYCADHPDHLPKSHQRWCKSYALYQRLVTYQQTKGRLEPKLPTKVMIGHYKIPEKMNEVLASMYQEKIDMNDIQYAALTQLATAPLTTAYCLQLYRSKAISNYTNGVHRKQTFTIHVVGAELQFEADALNKWEVFFLHLRPDVEELRVVLISPLLNPGNLPLDLLRNIKLCEDCRENKRRVVFSFEDNKNYFEYRTSEDFINPDIICAFNPSIQRSSVFNGKDPWPVSIDSIIKLKQPFVLTAYTLNELRKDIARIRSCTEVDFKLILEPSMNNFASVRPDRNFISDDEMPLLFKNYCVAVVMGC